MEICILSKLANNQLNKWINPKTKIGFLLQDILKEIATTIK